MPAAVTLRAFAKQVSASIYAADLAAGTFAIGGDIPTEQPQERPSATSTDKKAKKSEEKKVSSAPVVLRWDNPADHPGPHRVSFPQPSRPMRTLRGSSIEGFEHLLKVSEKATFGLNGRHEFDETYRKAQKLGADDFCTSFCPYETGIIDAICQVLLPSLDTAKTKRSIRAELYNMNVSGLRCFKLSLRIFPIVFVASLHLSIASQSSSLPPSSVTIIGHYPSWILPLIIAILRPVIYIYPIMLMLLMLFLFS